MRNKNMKSRNSRVMVRCIALLPLLVSLAASPAQSKKDKKSDPDAAVAIKIAKGQVKMPAGVDLGRLQLVNEARLIRVYTQMSGVGDTAADETLLFQPEVAEQIRLTNRQVNRRFMDMILAARRFQVFDDSPTVIRDQA